MKTVKFLATLLLFLTLSFPMHAVMAQSNDETSLTEEYDTKDKKSEKKKDKDVVEINKKFFLCLLIDITTILLIIVFIYYPNYKKMDNIFTLIVFNVVIFLLTFVLNKVKISMGAAFGLFAVFSMLRYRTAGISMKDMTYIFIFIAVGLISAIQLEYSELAIVCAIIFAVTFLLDSNLIFKRELSKYILFENIDLIKPECEGDLLDELRKRTGLKIHRVSILKINYLRDLVELNAYYYD